MEPLRSLLFIPGNRARFLEKARDLAPDALVPDLESSVPEPDKATARQMVKEALPGLATNKRQIYLRVNPVDSPYILDDLNALISEHLTGVIIPRIQSADEVRRLDEIITNLEQGKNLPFGLTHIVPFIETALGVMRAFEIATASSRIVAIAFGAEDFTADMGVARSVDGAEIMYARNTVAIAARAAHRVAIDAPFVTINDAKALESDARLALRLGFKGKFAIHPSQIESLNSIFSPSEEEIAQAKRIIKAFQQAITDGNGTCSMDGMMIDSDIALRAQKLLRTADTISRRTG